MNNNVSVILFTMKGCPHCTKIKEMLNNENIHDYHERDIDEYKDEYDLFCEITNSDSVPALLVIEGDSSNNKSYLYAPDRDYNTLFEAVDIVKRHLN